VAVAAGLLVFQLGWPSSVSADNDIDPLSSQVSASDVAGTGQPPQAVADVGAPSAAPAGRLSFTLPAPQPDPHNGKLPLFFEADALEGESGTTTRATGSVRLRQGALSVEADELSHSQSDNMARAAGHVRIMRGGNIFSGPELTLKLDTLEGEFVHPALASPTGRSRPAASTWISMPTKASPTTP